ncbi:MAG: hypothetical protein CMN30_27410 [Sandaracinus sp.]|nr:hypothetical protein [Sandaracinus sp.]
MTKARFLVLLLAIGTATAVAQPQEAPEAPEAPAEAPAAEGAPEVQRSEAEVARRARVYAQVGDVAITVGAIEDAIAAQSPFVRGRYRDPARLRELADSLVRFELLARAAAAEGYGENAAVEQQVKQQMVQRLIEQQVDDVVTRESISAEDVQAYYAEHEAEFARPAMVRASHILLPSREAADALLAEARDADNRQFRALAREHSIDTETKLRGGDLRYFTNTGRPPGANEEDAPVDAQLVAAAFELEDLGDVGGPVAVGENWSIVKLTGKREPEVRGLEQAGEGIRLRLWRERRQAAIDDFVRGLRDRAEVELHPDLMRPIRLDPVEPTEGLPHRDPHGDGREMPQTGEAPQAGEAPPEPEGQQGQ